MKKQIKIISLLLLLLLVFSSCKKQDETKKDTNKKTEKQEEVIETEPLEELEEEPAESIDDETVIDSVQSNPNDVYDATGFVLVSDVIPNVILDIRYYSTYNFVGERINGYEEPVALISKEAASALLKVSQELESQGYVLKIFDAYRPQRAVEHFVSWAANTNDTRMKPYFYPEVAKSSLFSKGYIARKSGHSRGSTVDLTLFDLATGKEVDMGGPFDFFGQLSHPDYKGITTEQYNNRMLLRNTMKKYGFKPCGTEWWHYTLANEPYPRTYFAFPVSTESLKEK